jgi:hypothetical protein
LEALPLVGAFITIARAVRDIYKHFKKDDETKAIEKAITAIEGHLDIREDEAKQTYQQTLVQALGEERAAPVVRYTDLVESFLPLKPRGRVLAYGHAIEQLVIESHAVLYHLDAFKLLGEPQNSARTLDFPQTAYSLYGQMITRAVVSDGDYSLRALLFEMPHQLLGGPKARYREAIDDLLVLRAEQDGNGFWIFLRADEASPFSLTLEANGRTSQKKLEHYQFGHLVDAIMSDTNSHLDRIAHEYEKSRDTAERFAQCFKALKEMRGDLEKSRAH